MAMVSEGTLSQLERMAGELKCGICFNLYKDAVTISCNHTFCRSCILDFIRGQSSCPVCKAHTTRREIRPSPQMDNLVDIFKAMESSAGISLFPKASIPAQAPAPVVKVKSKAKGGSKRMRANSLPQGVVLAKKRIQVPRESELPSSEDLQGTGSQPSHPSETYWVDPVPGISESSLIVPVHENVSNHHQQQEISQRLVEMLQCEDVIGQDKPNLDSELKDFPSLRQAFSELPLQLTPFFWLPNEALPSQDEILTQTQLTAQPVRPEFSDLKDSDDDGSLDDVQQPIVYTNGFGETSGYDSDTFEWTQRPCSPELSCSPERFHNMRNIRTSVLQEPFPLLTGNKNLESLPKSMDEMDKRDIAASASKFLDLLRAGSSDSPPEPNLVKPDDSNSSKFKASAPLTRIVSYKSQTPEKLEVNPKIKTGVEIKAPCSTEEDSTEPEPDCRFCGKTGNSEVVGELMAYQISKLGNRILHVHKLCAEWAPNVYFKEDDKPMNLTVELTRGSKIKCSVCGMKGAALGCCNSKCKNSYHYPCARSLKGCHWKEDDYVMYCPLHARGKGPKVRRHSRESSTSTLEVEPTKILSNATELTLTKAVRKEIAKKEGPMKKCMNTPLEIKSKWDQSPTQKWVLCGSGLDSSLKVQVASFASLTGATLVNQWSSAVTHVITGTDEQGAAKRTLKYLLAMLEGKWIVRVDWMLECIHRKQPVAEELYLVNCDVNGFFGGPSLSRHLAASQARKLFEGLSFFLCGEFTYVLKANLHSLIAGGGGTILHRKPLPLSGSSYLELSPPLQATPQPGQTIVLYNGEPDSNRGRYLASRMQEAMSVSIPAGAYALPCSWLLDSIAHCRVLPPN